MDRSTIPLRVLIAAPHPTHASTPPDYARLEALLESLEAQGDLVQIDWLWPSTVQTLARLSADPSAAAQILYLRTTSLAETGGAFELEDQRIDAESFGALLRDLPIRLILLDVAGDLSAVDLDRMSQALASQAQRPVVRLDGAVAPVSLQPLLAQFLAALLMGRTPSQALEEANRTAGAHTMWLFAEGQDEPLVDSPSKSTPETGKVVRFPSPNLAPGWQRLPDESLPGGLPAEPVHGFVGRGRELAAIEQALRSDQGNGVVLVHGYEGSGRTTLAAHAARWLVRTGRFSRVVYTDLSSGSRSESALFDLGTQLVGNGFSLKSGDSLAAIEEALAAEPTLIVWDGLDTLLPGGERPLPADALREFLQLGLRFAALGQSRLCVVANTPDLPSSSYNADQLALQLSLGGLVPEDAQALFERIQPQAAVAPEVIAELDRLLGGQPLALCVLASLDDHRVADLPAELERILPGFGRGEGLLRNQALSAVLELLLRSFDENVRPAVEVFGLFSYGFMERMAVTIVDLEESSWQAVAERLTAAQVLREVPIAGFHVPYMVLHPAFGAHLARRISGQRRTALAVRFYGSYMGLLNWVSNNEKKLGTAARLLVRRELPNYRVAIQMLLEAQELSIATDLSHSLQRHLDALGFSREQAALAERVSKSLAEAVPEEGPLGRPGVQLLLSRAEHLSSQGQVSEAAAILQRLVTRMQAEKGLSYEGAEAALDKGTALHRLGRCLQRSGRPDVVLGLYRQALGLLSSPETHALARRELQQLQTDLGEVLLAAGQLEPAQEAFTRALSLAGDLTLVAPLGTLNAQLGSIAMARQDPEQARSRFQAALAHMERTEDLTDRAGVWSQLGTLAWQSGDLSEAERCLLEAVSLAEKAGIPALNAQTWMQLAQLAEKADRIHDAEDRYARAIGVFQQHQLRPGQFLAEIALAGLLLDHQQLPVARAHAEAARALAEGSRLDAEAWRAFALLERIAHAEGQTDRETFWRQRTREAFARSPEAEQVLMRWRPVVQGVAPAARGETLDEATVGLLESLEERPEWRQVVTAIWRILGGERSEELYEGLDHSDALVVTRLLRAIENPNLEQEEAAAAAKAQAAAAVQRMVGALPQLLNTVAAALNGNEQAAAQATTVLNSMSQEGAPEPLQHFADAVKRIMQGERGPAVLHGLPPQLAAPLQALLNRLGGKPAK
ncbi:MAG: tetratricopeptide repeat protein [Anaerolineae bacterium]